MKFTIHRGSHEIGGTCIEVQHGETRLVMDIGMPLVTGDNERFDMIAYKGLSGRELIDKGVLPDIAGFYAWGQQDKPIDGLLISHAHQDHYGFYGYLRQDIPCYLGEGTRDLMGISRIFSGKGQEVENYTPLQSGRTFQIGSILVTPWLMDHSAFDAYAFHLEADGKRLLYTGDFRSHGRKPYAIERLIKNIPSGVDCLLMEGTLIGREGSQQTEHQIEEELRKLFMGTKHLVMVAASGQNIDRLVSVYRAARRTGRQFIIDPYIANVLDKLARWTPSLPRPSTGFPDIRVYFPNRITKRLKHLGRSYDFTKYRQYKITCRDIADDLVGSVMLIRPSVLDYLDRIEGIDGATVVWSQWPGYLEDDSTKVFREFINAKRMTLAQIHTSGHATLETLKYLVSKLRPKVLVPIHTNNPQVYGKLFSDVSVIVADDGVPVAFTNVRK